MADGILVIKLGALGDFVQALGAMAAIRLHHREDRVTLLTTPPFAALGRESGYFDEIWVHERRDAWTLRRKMRAAGFKRVYDLQTSDRSSFYFQMLLPGRRPEWCGIARGCSHPHANPLRTRLHTENRLADQLAAAGIADVPAPDLSWIDAKTDHFDLGSDFVLFCPGGSAHRPLKRWPAESYAALGRELPYTPVLIGGQAEAEVLARLQALLPRSRNLCGATSLFEIAGLARRARAAIGNDTGPMHLIAATGCPSFVLFSGQSDPSLCGQRGPHVTILRRDPIDLITPSDLTALLHASMFPDSH